MGTQLIHQTHNSRKYESSIPTDSQAVEDQSEDGFIVKTYWKEKKEVGRRIYDEQGNLYWEYGLKDQKYHGNYYYFWEDGSIQYQCTYCEGKVTGLVAQWSESGSLMMVTEFVDGTGVDLWCQEEDGEVHLSEERHYLDGQLHGYVRWWDGEDKVWQEHNYRHSEKHGISREWDGVQLIEGYPKYYIHEQEVSLEEYMDALSSNKELDLPKIIAEENLPYRDMNAHFMEMKKEIRKFEANL